MPLEFQAPESISDASRSPRHRRRQRKPAHTESPTEELTTAAGLRAEVNHSLRRRTRILTVSLSLMCISVILSLVFFSKINLIPGIYTSRTTPLTLAYIALVTPLLAIFATAGYVMRSRTDEMRRQVRALRAAGTNGAASIVIDLLNSTDPSMRRYATLGLHDMLSNWSEEDMAALRHDQRATLRTVLIGGDIDHGSPLRAAMLLEPTLELRFAICRAYGRMGGHNELTVLRELLARPVDNAADHALQDAAQTAAVQLETRLGKQLPTHVLLRASDAPLDGCDNLLRAAQPSTLTAERELLRPGMQDEAGAS